MTRRFALLIGNSEYQDPGLARLRAPEADLKSFADLLRHPEIGGFDETTVLLNQPAADVRRAIASFFRRRTREDLLLLYFSGHGVVDDQGRLYLAVRDSERDLLSATAVEAAFITAEMDRSHSQRHVLILDCCHSGAFARGAKAATGGSVGTASAFEGTGFGRVVLTATDSTQYAWEGDRVIGDARNSLFTHFLIEGLGTGDADANRDGDITLDELYDYAYSRVLAATPNQTPGKWAFRQQGEMIIARNPRAGSRLQELPQELQQAIESPFAAVREGAVRELEKLLLGRDRGLSVAAHAALKRLAEDDSRSVSAAARAVLERFARVGVQLETGPPRPPERPGPVVAPALLTTAGWVVGEFVTSARGVPAGDVPYAVLRWVVLSLAVGFAFGKALRWWHGAKSWIPGALVALVWCGCYVVAGHVIRPGDYHVISFALAVAGAGCLTGWSLRAVEHSIGLRQILILCLCFLGASAAAVLAGVLLYSLSLPVGAIGFVVATLALIRTSLESLAIFWQLDSARSRTFRSARAVRTVCGTRA